MDGREPGLSGCLWIVFFLCGIGLACLLGLAIWIGLELYEWAAYL
jgi:hypothetical protein